jgi:hypothetical protein
VPSVSLDFLLIKMENVLKRMQEETRTVYSGRIIVLSVSFVNPDTP